LWRYTRIPTNFWTWLPHLTDAEKTCYLVVVRHTIGYNKPADQISSAQFEQETGFSRTSISLALKSLEVAGLLKITRRHRQISLYEPLPVAYLCVKPSLR
jgi:hypothetical protein